MSDVRKVERPTRAKVDPLAEATKKWDTERALSAALGIGYIENQEAAKNMFAPPQALNQATERDKSPIDAALESLESATNSLERRICELELRLSAVSLPSTPIVGNERKPANCPMEEVILDRCDDVLAAHDRLRGIIERLQL